MSNPVHALLRSLSDHMKQTIDGLSVVALLGTLAQWLPALASLFTLIWTAIRIYETRTVQGWLGRPVPIDRKDDDDD